MRKTKNYLKPKVINKKYTYRKNYISNNWQKTI